MANEKKRRWTAFTTIDEIELSNPDLITPIKIAVGATLPFIRERAGQVIGSAFLLLMFWGYHGELETLGAFWPAFNQPAFDVIPFLDWDRQIFWFWGGCLLVVVIPILLIKFVYKEPLSWYGLGWPPAGRRRLAFSGFVVLMVMGVVAAFSGAADEGMQQTYPLYRNFATVGQFLLYELSYIPFFLAIEFIFRGYLLFGLAGVTDDGVSKSGSGFPGQFYFHRYALLIQMLSYTAWHLGKPLPELWGTLVWGLMAGAIAYSSRSIWLVFLAHFLFNLLMDWQILVKTGEWAQIAG